MIAYASNCIIWDNINAIMMKWGEDDMMNEHNETVYETDYLTKLPNRRALYNYYSSLRADTTIHAMFIDIDNFKRVNDVYGHSMGDELLINVSNLISDSLDGFVSRIGGDEFVVFLDGDISEDIVCNKAQQLIDSMPDMNFRKDILSLISLSVGIVFQQNTSQNLDDVLAKCDAAMYQSKFNGKNKYTIFHSDDKILEINRNIELEMEGALERGEFIVYLQPKVNMISSKIVGAEALSRWQHPIDGIRVPAMYIDLFEKNGFISQLDMYIFREVCKLKKSWKGLIYEHIPISINMSRLHLYNKDFPETLNAIAEEYDIPRDELEIELTENIFIKDTSEMINMVERLQAMNFQVSIDDFGSGFSALNLLKDLNVNTIKLDKEFLQHSYITLRGRKVIKSVITMCRDLKIHVVTEGVEEESQISLLTRCGCQIAQGFYYSKPVPVDDFIVFAEQHLSNFMDHYTFHFNGNLNSEDGSLKGIMSGKVGFGEGIFIGSKSLEFPGGKAETNVIELPPEAISNESYTVSFWIRVKEEHSWTSAVYIKFETGFSSFAPLAWEGHSDFRIRDSREVNGWYDLHTCQLANDLWWHVVISYNSQTEKALTCVNGDPIGEMENVFTNRFVKRIIVGGDVFQPSLIGNICELNIYNEAKDYESIKDLYHSYIDREDFNAYPQKHLM